MGESSRAEERSAGRQEAEKQAAACEDARPSPLLVSHESAAAPHLLVSHERAAGRENLGAPGVCKLEHLLAVAALHVARGVEHLGNARKDTC